jgi:translation initiation factor IF-2
MAGKPIRLGKAAGELNVGIPTIVEFLGSKGIVIDPTPTSRLEQEHYEILCQEFAADQSMKEQSKAALRREKRESLSIKDKPLEDQKPAPIIEDEDEGDINLEEIKRQVLSEATPKAPEPKAEAVNPVIEEVVAAEPSAEVSENKVNVIGKIDLDALNQKTRPDKKKEKVVEKQPEAAPVVPSPEVVKEAPAPQPEPTEDPVAKAPEIETIRVARQTLSGPTVLGKIELPVERQRTPVASSSEDANSKRKRKRIKKVEVSNTPNNVAKKKWHWPSSKKKHSNLQSL